VFVVFESKQAAALAYEVVRDVCSAFKECPSREQVKRNIKAMREAAVFASTRTKPSKTGPDDKELSQRGRKQDYGDASRKGRMVAGGALEPRTEKVTGRVVKDLVDEIGPGWTCHIVPRKQGPRNDYFYFAPSGEKFRSLPAAKKHALKTQKTVEEVQSVEEKGGGVPDGQAEEEEESKASDTEDATPSKSRKQSSSKYGWKGQCQFEGCANIAQVRGTFSHSHRDFSLFQPHDLLTYVQACAIRTTNFPARQFGPRRKP